ncbi:YceI family protein [Kordia sp. YSTF-M3]|uniref:YceI family protein n=1 Tax=Kordia aestuariivivens TaxID=2759037 RepID=A0ABR7QDD6_9FLAO|nr:YceI family protein [Kordia aestuariivivens]MBC8756580.1 YceI family protein [Kordia aestuariivivens]
MQKILVLCLLFVVGTVSAQKYYTKTGETDFKASVDAFEPVEAKSNSTTSILKVDTGDLAALLFMKSFHFKVALMEEHFNENYMDSDKFPKATFKGKLKDFNMSDLSATAKEYKLSGTLTVRGKAKEIETTAMISKDGDKIVIKSFFTVKPQDFDIDIPSIVRDKIAKEINVTLNYELVEKK